MLVRVDSPQERAAPGEELAALARGLRKHVERRMRSGVRRAALPAGKASPPRPALLARVEPVAPARLPATAGKLFAAERLPSVSTSPIAELARSAPDLETLRERVAACVACSLCKTRTQTVFSDGTGKSGVLFVGEAPGEQEDLRGVPFVGRAGQLLTDIIEKGMGLAREDVYICNVLKCRPPENRDPTIEEKELCTSWLDRQIELVRPRLVIALGRHAAGHLLSTQLSLGRLRGRIHDRSGCKVLVTYHPAYLLRSPGEKKECWKDIQIALQVLGLPVPRKGQAAP
jgi:DNA polymerase